MFSLLRRKNSASWTVRRRQETSRLHLEALENRSLPSVIRLAFDSLPSAQGWTYISGNRQESGVFSVDGTTLRMNSMGTGFRPAPAYHYYEYANAISLNQPFTVSATVRVRESEAFDANFTLTAHQTGGQGVGIGIGTREIWDVLSRTGGVRLTTGDFQTAPHDYRLEVSPTAGFRLYVDGNFIGSGPWASYVYSNRLHFGDTTMDGNSRVEMTRYEFRQTGGNECFVFNANDSGPGSLRDCINWTNAHAGHDTIRFDIAGPGVKTINIASSLPTITDPVVIDGYSQPGASPNTRAVGNDAVQLIELNGTSVVGQGLAITAGNCLVKGLVINSFRGNGIVLGTNGGNMIQGNFIGTNAQGTADRGNTQSGVFIEESSNNTIGGTAPAARNVISGNDNYGIVIRGANSRNNQVLGNYVGTNASGTEALGNSWHGVKLLAGPSANRIGGSVTGAGNLISANESGVEIDQAPGNQVFGNYIGTDAAGTAALGNTAFGVGVFNAPNNSIGDSVANTGNVISGNLGSGIRIEGPNARHNGVQGNYIGTNAAGMAALPNTLDGVHVFSAPDNTIGGTTAVMSNLVSGNRGVGVWIGGATATDNRVQGNRIGTNATGGDALMGNLLGGVKVSGASRNLIGGTDPGAANRIAYNARQGVTVVNGTGNSIRRNAIFSNAELGIDIGDDYVTWHNITFLISAWTIPNLTFAQGLLFGVPYTRYEVEFFANSDADPSLFGEGETYLGTDSVWTDGDGLAYFQSGFSQSVPPGYCISATATDPAGSTWEFGYCVPVESGSGPGGGSMPGTPPSLPFVEHGAGLATLGQGTMVVQARDVEERSVRPAAIVVRAPITEEEADGCRFPVTRGSSAVEIPMDLLSPVVLDLLALNLLED